MSESLGLDLQEVVVRYRRRGLPDLPAVDGVTLSVAPGEVVGLVGESGCGKSTLARAVCGLEPVASGTAAFEGQPITRLRLRPRPAQLRRIQMVFQNPNASLNPRRTAGSQISDARSIHPLGTAPTVADLLASVGLDPGLAAWYPHELSGGQKQRVAIARAIASGPSLLIGDEPIASLDASLQARVARLLRQVATDSGAGLLFISHDLSVVRLIADRIAVMRAGRIVEQAPTEQLWNDPQDPYTRRLLAAIPIPDGLGHLPEVDGLPALSTRE
jgi:ABC-type glutathione transport system ATPase component